MTKEIVICIIIFSLVIVGNLITQNYTNDSIDEAIENLRELRGKLFQEDIEIEQIQNESDSIYEKWSNRHEKLAYYIEHDELEKVKTDLIAITGYIDIEEYKEAVPELYKTIFVLEHIKNKSMFNLKNIF